jgi:transposase-like protein
MKRKRYTQEFKDQVIKESLEVGNANIVARKHDLSANMVSRWVREHKNQNKLASGFPYSNGHNQSAKALESENEKLKKLLGEKDLEIAILKDLVKKTNPQLKIIEIASKWIAKGYCATWYYDWSDLAGQHTITG